MKIAAKFILDRSNKVEKAKYKKFSKKGNMYKIRSKIANFEHISFFGKIFALYSLNFYSRFKFQ